MHCAAGDPTHCTADRRFDSKVKCLTGRASFWVKFPTVRSLTPVKCPGIAQWGMGGFGIDWYFTVFVLEMHWTYGGSLSQGPMFPRLIDELYPSFFSSLDFSPRIAIRRNLIYADSFLFIFRFAASIYHALFNHFLRLLRESSHIPTTQACMLSFSYVTLGTLAEWETNANDRWKNSPDYLHFQHS